MYRKNEKHKQAGLFEDHNYFSKRKQKLLEDSWALKFYKEVFCRIEEDLFKCLYTEDFGRPNVPVNILAGLDIIKELKGYTDEELLQKFHFDYQVMYSLGIRKFGSTELGIRTLYYFRKRVAEYFAETGINLTDMLFNEFVSQYIDEYEIDASEQRMDSSMVKSNMKKLSRLQLCVLTLQKFLNSLSDTYLERVPADIARLVTEEGVGTYMENANGSNYDSKLIDIGTKIFALLELFSADEDIVNIEEYKLLERLFNDQFKIMDDNDKDDDKFNKIELKTSAEISSSALQNPSDPEATYRKKNGESYQGYKVNVSETHKDENSVNILTEANVYPNNKSDKEILEEEASELRDRTGVGDLNLDGGYEGKDTESKLKGKGIDLHYSGIKGRKSDKRKKISEHFTVSENRVVSCKNGEEPISSKRNEKGRYTIYKFSKNSCRRCPYRDSCPVEEQKKSNRLLIYERTLEILRREKEIDRVKQKRAPIESVFFVLKHRYRMKDIPIRGLYKMNYYVKLKAIAFNFARIMRYLDRKLIIDKKKLNKLAKSSIFKNISKYLNYLKILTLKNIKNLILSKNSPKFRFYPI